MSRGPLFPPSLRFEGFEADLYSKELRKNGLKVRLQEQPFHILAMLLDRPGELVTREEIQKSLWPSDTFVDYEHSINTAIMRLREALDDDAEHHRLIETLPRRGYRFLAVVEPILRPDAPHENTVWSEFNSVSRVMPISPSSAEEQGEMGSFSESDPARSQEVLPVHRPAGEGTQAPPVPPGYSATKTFRPHSLRWPLPAYLVAGGGVLALIAWAYIRHVQPTEPRINSIAVLPLQNLSRDPEQEYFALGMTEALITELSRQSTLRVVPFQSVSIYKGSRKSLPQIAKELGVDGVIEGVVQRSQGRIRISAHMVYAKADRVEWAKTYEGDLREILTLQENFARAVADEVHASPASRESPPAARRKVNPGALDDYMRGQYYWSHWPEGWDRATESFRRATERDPDFAPAWAGFGMATALSAINRPREEVYQSAASAAQRAAKLDPTLSEAHLALAFSALYLDWDWSRAEREAEAALRLKPTDPGAHAFYAMYLAYVGRGEESIAEAKRARQFDPFSMFTNLVVVEALMYAGHSQEAVEEARKTLELNPGQPGVLAHLAESYALAGNFTAASAEVEKMGTVCSLPFIVTHAVSNHRKRAVDCMHQNEDYARHHYVSPFWLAVPHAALGEPDRAFEFLHQAFEERAGAMATLKTEPYLRALHSDPRFQVLVRKMNYPQ